MINADMIFSSRINDLIFPNKGLYIHKTNIVVKTIKKHLIVTFAFCQNS